MSTDEQKEGRTIESQLQELKNFAQTRDDLVVRQYCDDGWSGALLNRPALDSLRDDAARHLFDAVLVNDVDRLSRDVVNLVIIKRELEAEGLELIFRNLPHEKSPMGDFIVNIAGSVAELERAMIADRTRRGRRHKVEKRHLIAGNLPPYGFRYLKRDREAKIDGRYEVLSEEARVVRRMFAWVDAKGLSVRGVVGRLRESHIRPRKGGTWAQSTVHRILTNETYAGITYYNKNQVTAPVKSRRKLGPYSRKNTGRRLRDRSEWIPIPLPPELHIVDRKTYDRVQSRLAANRAYSLRNTKRFYLLREVRKVCALCGSTYAGTPYHGRRFYRCGGRDRLRFSFVRDKCRAPIISAAKIEPLVWTAVIRAAQNPDLILEQVKRLAEKERHSQYTVDAELAVLEHDRLTIQGEEERILAAYRASVINLDQLDQELAKVSQRREALNKLQSDLRQKTKARPPLRVASRALDEWSAIARDRLNSFNDSERARFLADLLSEILIAPDCVTIRGEIPMIAPDDAGVESDHFTNNPNGSRDHISSPGPASPGPGAASHNERATSYIAPTPIGGYGHNPTIPFEFALDLLPRNRVGGAVTDHTIDGPDESPELAA